MPALLVHHLISSRSGPGWEHLLVGRVLVEVLATGEHAAVVVVAGVLDLAGFVAGLYTAAVVIAAELHVAVVGDTVFVNFELAVVRFDLDASFWDPSAVASGCFLVRN